jgi:hypothetical protein
MTGSTRLMLRAYLMTASVAAAGIQSLIVMPMTFLFRVPVEAFETTRFRMVALLVVSGSVFIARGVASCVFHAAVRRGDVTFAACGDGVACIPAACARRKLIVLHLHFARMRYENRVVASAEVDAEADRCEQENVLCDSASLGHDRCTCNKPHMHAVNQSTQR